MLLSLAGYTIFVACPDMVGYYGSAILISWDVGVGIGIIAGGAIAEHLGYATAFWTVSVTHALGVLLYFVRTRRFFLSGRLDQPSAS